VIDSVESGTMDGLPETGASWRNQEFGAYAGWLDSRNYSLTPYTDAVGICLAADLDRGTISEAQNQTLLHLVQELQARCRIPRERVLFQWELNAEMPATAGRKALAQAIRAAL
jgi:hypothetical protein